MLYRFLWALIISPTLEKEKKDPKKKMDHILQKTIKRLRWGFNTSLLGSKLGNFLKKGGLLDQFENAHQMSNENIPHLFMTANCSVLYVFF